MDSSEIKEEQWLWWVGEDVPVYIWENLYDGWVVACVPRPTRDVQPTMVTKVVRALDLERLGKFDDLEF
jgi:hypothetical protein